MKNALQNQHEIWLLNSQMNAQKQNFFSNILYFQKTQKMQKLLKHSRWLLKIVRWAEYDAKDGEN